MGTPALEAFHSIALDKRVFFFRPQIMKRGFLTWHIAAWDKKPLLDFYEKLKKLPDAWAELIGIRQEKFNFFMNNALTDLTGKQLAAFQLACQNRYYTYPCHISLQQLSRTAKTSYSTFKEHLRRAEEKIMPRVVSYD